jgi:hypothetical protein
MSFIDLDSSPQRSPDEGISVLGAYLIGLEEILTHLEKQKDKDAVFGFAATFTHMLIAWARTWHEKDGLYIAQREDDKFITRTIAAYPQIIIHARNDVVVFGETFLNLLKKREAHLANELLHHLNEDLPKNGKIDPDHLNFVMRESVRAVEIGFRTSTKFKGRYHLKRKKNKDSRQHKKEHARVQHPQYTPKPPKF